MIFIVNGTYTVWLPVYTLQDHSYNSHFYRFLLFVELLLSVVALIFTVTTVNVVTTFRAFHINLSFLLAVVIGSWMLSLVSRTMLTPYLTGLWDVGAMSDEYQCWWTDDVTQMAPIRSISEGWILFVGGFLTWYYMFIMVTCLFIFSLERTFSSYFISNYETLPRAHISVLLAIFQQGMVLVMDVICFFNKITLAPAIAFCVVLKLLAVLTIWGNRKYSSIILKRFEKQKKENQIKYSLGAKFQAKENMKAFDLTIRVIIVGFLLIFSAMLCITALNYHWITSCDILLVYTLENIVHLNPIIVCPVLIFSVSTWSKSLLHSKCKWVRKITNLTFIDIPSLPEQNTDLQKETDTYFIQLQTSWAREHKK